MTHHTRIADVASFITKDGSVIRELMHPNTHSVRHQSFAEARVPPGATTQLHRHHRSEEIYHITQGRGHMTLGSEQFDVNTGDTICIAPGTPHNIRNTGDVELKILCACAPPYAHNDTELLGEET